MRASASRNPKRTQHLKEEKMRVREFMNASPITVSPTTPVAEARDLMQRRRIRHLLVVDGERLVGIISDRDIRQVLSTRPSVLEMQYVLAMLTVQRVMSRWVVPIAPDRPVADAVRLMLENKIGALPVTEGERVVGIITETDLLRAFARVLVAHAEPVTHA